MITAKPGRRLRSSAILHGPVPKASNDAYKRKGLAERKQRLDEAPGRLFP